MKYHGKEMTTLNPRGYYAMTWEDAEKMELLNEANGWGLNLAQCLHCIADHMEANGACLKSENPFYLKARARQEMIEWRLEDANFHMLGEFLRFHDYIKATKWVYDEFAEVI